MCVGVTAYIFNDISTASQTAKPQLQGVLAFSSALEKLGQLMESKVKVS